MGGRGPTLSSGFSISKLRGRGKDFEGGSSLRKINYAFLQKMDHTRVPCNQSLFKPRGALINFGYLWGWVFPYFGVLCLIAEKVENRKEGGLIQPKCKKLFSISGSPWAQRAIAQYIV